MADLEVLPHPRWSAAVRIEQGLVRRRLEDAWRILFDTPFAGGTADAFAVFDGLGGEPHGDKAARAAAEFLPAALAEARTHREVLARLNDHVLPTGGATTAVIALFPSPAFEPGWLLSVGDSAAYGIDASDAVSLLVTKDSGARNEVADYLGNPHLKGHAAAIGAPRGRALALVTDGVDGVAPPAELGPILRAEPSGWRPATATLFDRLFRLGAPDNATLLLVRRA